MFLLAQQSGGDERVVAGLQVLIKLPRHKKRAAMRVPLIGIIIKFTNTQTHTHTPSEPHTLITCIIKAHKVIRATNEASEKDDCPEL